MASWSSSAPSRRAYPHVSSRPSHLHLHLCMMKAVYFPGVVQEVVAVAFFLFATFSFFVERVENTPIMCDSILAPTGPYGFPDVQGTELFAYGVLWTASKMIVWSGRRGNCPWRFGPIWEILERSLERLPRMNRTCGIPTAPGPAPGSLTRRAVRRPYRSLMVEKEPWPTPLRYAI